MRLIHYINEGKNIPWNKIQKDCQPYLKDLKSTEDFLYSGRKINSPALYFKRKVRKDRKPLDTPEIIHNLLDDMFKKKFGHNLRSESLFVSKLKRVARCYGNLYVVLPIGKYSLYTNHHINDLWEKILYEIDEFYYFNMHNQELMGSYDDAIKCLWWDLEEFSKLKQTIMQVIDIAISNYKEVLNNKITKKSPEIMLLTDEYYGINVVDFTEKYIFSKLKGIPYETN